jgi:hypothetical protein
MPNLAYNIDRFVSIENKPHTYEKESRLLWKLSLKTLSRRRIRLNVILFELFSNTQLKANIGRVAIAQSAIKIPRNIENEQINQRRPVLLYLK